MKILETSRARVAAPFGLVAVALAAMSLASCSSGPTLGACDDPAIQAGLKSGIDSSSHMTISAITNIQTVSKTDKSAVCKMHIKSTSGAEADVTYNLTLDGKDTKYETTDVTATPSAAAAAAPAAADAAPAPAADDAKKE